VAYKEVRDRKVSTNDTYSEGIINYNIYCSLWFQKFICRTQRKNIFNLIVKEYEKKQIKGHSKKLNWRQQRNTK